MPNSEWAGSPAAPWRTGPRPSGAFALAERLASVDAAAIQLGTTWPSLCKAIARHGLGIPAGNPEAVRQETIAAAINALVSPPPHAPGGRGVLRVAGGRGPGGCRRRQGGRLHGVPCRAGERRKKRMLEQVRAALGMA
jgi:hypothetical protein